MRLNESMPDNKQYHEVTFAQAIALMELGHELKTAAGDPCRLVGNEYQLKVGKEWTGPCHISSDVIAGPWTVCLPKNTLKACLKR